MRIRAQQYDRALDDRQSKVTSLASQHDIRGFDINPLEEHQIQDFGIRLHEEVEKKRNILTELRVSDFSR